jgi:hypothetical protein
MLSKNIFRGANEQHLFKIGFWRATSIQKTWHLDSIVARALHVAVFIDSIDPDRTSAPIPGHAFSPSLQGPNCLSAFVAPQGL